MRITNGKTETTLAFYRSFAKRPAFDKRTTTEDKKTTMKNQFCLALALLCACSLLVVGCTKGPKKVHITGTVMVGEELVETGLVKFKSVGEGPEDGAPIKDGQFEADVVPGEKIVEAYGSKVVGEFEADPALNPGVMSKKLEDFPAKVWKEEIKVTIENKKNQNIEIKYSGNGPAN